MTIEDAIAKHQPWQHPWEMTEMLTFLLARQPKVVLEIGTHRGGSARVFRDILHPDLIVTIDKEAMAEGNMEGITCIVGTSQHKETQRQVREALADRAADFVFIDGGHSYPEVTQDWQMYGQFASDNGIIGVHDIGAFPSQQTHGCHVSLFWNEISSKNRTVEFRQEQGTGLVLL
jgi:cephalosporin hydroxylase